MIREGFHMASITLLSIGIFLVSAVYLVLCLIMPKNFLKFHRNPLKRKKFLKVYSCYVALLMVTSIILYVNESEIHETDSAVSDNYHEEARKDIIGKEISAAIEKEEAEKILVDEAEEKAKEELEKQAQESNLAYINVAVATLWSEPGKTRTIDSLSARESSRLVEMDKEHVARTKKMACRKIRNASTFWTNGHCFRRTGRMGESSCSRPTDTKK